jgi:hypothetical protein
MELMTFKVYDFDAMRNWLRSLSGSFEIRRARINIFDRYRYREDYEAIYNFIKEMGGEIEDD